MFFDMLLKILFLTTIIDLCLCGVYCILQENKQTRRIETDNGSKFNDNKKNKELRNKNSVDSVGIKFKIYSYIHCIDSYLYGLCRYTIILVGKLPSHRIRKFFYRYIFRMKISPQTIIYGGCEFRSPWNITIGKSIIGLESKLDGRNGIIIGDNVCFSTGVWLWTEQHSVNDEMFRCLDEGGPIIIDNRAWLSCRTTVLPGIHIGEGAVIAAGAVVTKDCEAFGFYGGIPAKKIGNRNNQLSYGLNEYWHFY